MAMLLWVGGLIYFFIDFANAKKLNQKKQIIESEANANLIEPRKEYLEKTAARFINGYNDYNNISSIQEALPKSDIEIPEIVYSESNTAKKESDEKYLNGEDKSNKEELIKLASENKIEAIKKYMELYNVGLAEAKIAVEKMLM